MQPCDECHACSFPERVAQARAVLPPQWATELVEGEAPDQVWVAAMNLYESFTDAGHAAPESFVQMLKGGILDEEDFAWARERLAAGM